MLERYLSKLTSTEPPRIAGFYKKYRQEGLEGITPAQLKMVLHLLPTEERSPIEQRLAQEDVKFWTDHMKFRRGGYEAIVRDATETRPEAAKFISPTDGEEIYDLGGGVGAMAPHLARLAGQLRYNIVEFAPTAKEPSEKVLGSLVKEGLIAEGKFIQHNITQGFPAVEPPTSKRRAISVMSASYFPTDIMQKLVENSFKAGCSQFDLVAIRGDFFVPDLIEQIEREIVPKVLRTEGGKEKIEKARSYYKQLIEFGAQIINRFPIRTLDETKHYLSQVGKVVKAKEMSWTMGLKVVPYSP